jgi:hypothetical protein
MDDLSHLERLSALTWAGWAVAMVVDVTVLPKQEAAAC